MSSSTLAPFDKTRFNAALEKAAQKCTEHLEIVLNSIENGQDSRLFSAMRYALLGGGKRLRAFLVLNSAELCGAKEQDALRVAGAIEMLHAYSLIHDDLPAMDDDDWRRGRPSLHRAFDEATAILAGDALLTQAFSELARSDFSIGAERQIRLVAALGQASGVFGMAAGQMLDIGLDQSGQKEDDFATVCHIESLKTGALFCFAARSGAIMAAKEGTVEQALIAYARDFGLAFQIRDDWLDSQGDPALLGKTLGKDEKTDKKTAVSILGIDGAQAEAERLSKQAISQLAQLTNDPDLQSKSSEAALENLAALAHFSAIRDF